VHRCCEGRAFGVAGDMFDVLDAAALDLVSMRMDDGLRRGWDVRWEW
jgi:hypothetical protein